MLEIGYKASAEQFDATELLGYARLAEEVGFDSIAVSDHFQPFRHTGGHAPAALPWLGALAATTSRARLGTSVSTPTMRFHPAVLAQAFATIENLAPGRVFVGVGTGEALNEVPATAMEWPGFSERLGRLEEAVELMRQLWTQERVTFEGRWYRTARATVYDRPERPLPILVAAAGPRAARFAGRVGDGFITTSGKPAELYTDTLLPAVEEGMRKAGRAAAGYERLLEVKVSYAADVETAIADCRYWAPLALPAEAKQGVDDPIELERLADAEGVHPESRFIVSADADEVAERIGAYVELGFEHLVVHAPGADQAGFLHRFAADVMPKLRARFVALQAGDGRRELGAEHLDRFEVVVQQVLQHHPLDAGVGQLGQPLGRLRDRAVDPGAVVAVVHPRVGHPPRAPGEVGLVGSDEHRGHHREHERRGIAAVALAGLVQPAPRGPAVGRRGAHEVVLLRQARGDRDASAAWPSRR